MKFNINHAMVFANKFGLDFSKELFNINDLLIGMNVELEHGKIDKETNVTNDNLILTGKIAMAHLREFPDYYRRLSKMEKEADKYWNKKRKYILKKID